jgi:hypothetical protein
MYHVVYHTNHGGVIDGYLDGLRSVESVNEWSTMFTLGSNFQNWVKYSIFSQVRQRVMSFKYLYI